MRRILCIFIIAAVVLIGTVAAAPVIPQGFYGSVFLNGNPAPVGTVIVAKINGDVRGEFITTVEGVYGDPGNFDPKLFVNATEEEANSGNATIIFFVGSVQAFQTVPFQSGGPGKLDLLANDRAFVTETTASPTYSTSGGASGGSAPASSSPASGTGTILPSGSSIQGTATATPVPTESRSSIYYSIDVPSITENATIVPTTYTIPSTTIATPTPTKAGMGPLSTMFIIVSVFAVLCIMGGTRYNRKR